MEILIRIDDDDKAAWHKIREMQNKLIVISRENSNQDITQEKIKLDKAVSDFWYTMIEKYPYLRNKRIGINSQDGYIFSAASSLEILKYSR